TSGFSADYESDNTGVIGAEIKDSGAAFTGSIDEVRLSTTARSAAWIKFEYYNMGAADNELVWGDTTASTFSPADDATGVSATANLVITFDEAVDPEAGSDNDITIKKTSGNSTVETIDAQDAKVTGGGTATITINPAATLAESTEYYVLIGADAFDDEAGNSYAGISSTTAWSFTTADATMPVISGTAATAGSAGADITWTTDEDASSQVLYGTTEALGFTTSEADTATRVQTHSVSLSDLPVCTKYFYRAISRDAAGNAGTGSLLNFTTTGCTNSATVSSQTGSAVTTAGGSLTMTNGGSGAALTVPASAATNTFTLQIKKIDKETVIAATSTPPSVSTIGDHTYDIRAISGSTLVTSFLQPITVTVDYTDDQMNGYDEPTLWIYRWDGSSWNALDGCTVNLTANSVTCTTTHFSTFGLFGDTTATGDSSNGTATTEGNGGRRGSTENMSTRIAAARATILARYEGKRQESIAIAASQQSSASSRTWSEQLAAEREREIAARIAERQARIAEIEKTKKEFEDKFALHLEERMARAAEAEQKKIDMEQQTLLAEQTVLQAEQEANAKKRKERLAEKVKQDAIEHAQEVSAAQEREARFAQRIADREAEIARIEQAKKEFEEKFALHLEERMANAAQEEQKKLDAAKAALLAEQTALQAEQEANAKRREERIAEREQLEEKETMKGAAASLETVAVRRDKLYAVVDETPVLYADVSLSAWYAPYVSFVVEEQIATGYADEGGKLKGEFGASNPVTYAEVLKMALKAAGKDAASLPPPRNGSAQGTWAAPFVAQAEVMSLSVFAPSLDVQEAATRGAVIQTILEVMSLPIANQVPPFIDVPEKHPYARAIATAAFFGLINGDTDANGTALGTFRPDAPITRAEVAKIVALVKEVMTSNN
ncbi:MAG: Ig-like domain-containing protein, partial [Candidatus Peribacteraceae bacterium]|nr:Ig-like domain-containing protein [Candidatus Peribacteraceae bacterium]